VTATSPLRRAGGVVVVGPAPPLRGGIAAHTARLVEHLLGGGTEASAISYRRLYPSMAFPGRSQRNSGEQPPWSEEVLDAMDPLTWKRVAGRLAATDATVVLQWWHPVTAPALLTATAGLARERLVAVCHNALPHENLPGSKLAARQVLGRCSRVLCHSEAERGRVRTLLGENVADVVHAPLPCLIAAQHFGVDALPPELRRTLEGSRLFVAAGHQRGYKGTALLLEVWSRLARPPDAKLVVAGECYLRGGARREVAGLAAADPSIVLLDRYVDDAELVSLLTLAEALVLPYLAASQSGLVPIARALDLACVVSDAGGLAEQVSADSEVVRAGDATELAGALRRRLARAPLPLRATKRQPDQRAIASDWRRVIEAMVSGLRP